MFVNPQLKELIMKRNFSLSALCVLALVSFSYAQDMPEMPKPQKEHEFLKKFVGEWESVGKGTPMEGQPAVECNATANTRMMGDFWMVSEGHGDAMGTPMETLMTVGYDTEKGKYVGTWVDSVFNHMWKYEGTVEGEKLTLNAEGPDMMNPGRMTQYQDIFEFKSPDHYTLTSRAQDKDGKWVTFMTAEVNRKK
jgi:hypothetical protein